MSFVLALKWSFFAELLSKAITPLVFIFLARLLTPEDFGVMTAALMVIAFSQIFWEAGMSKALIQRQTDVDEAADVAFWVNLGLGMVIAGLLFLGAQPIAMTFFQDERVIAVLQVMTLQVLLGALSSVQTALLQKEMGFKRLFWVRMTTVALPGFASIPLAWNGMGYWALVAGTLTGQVVQVIMLWRISAWRPTLRFPLSVALPMAKFGAWVGASGFMGWFYAWADSLIVGTYLGTEDLGIYRVGHQFSGLIFTFIFLPIVPVLYSYLSKIGANNQQLKKIVEKILRVSALIGIPIAILVFQFSDALAGMLFGTEWDGVGFVIGVLALMHGFSWVVGMNGEVFRAMGRPSLETIITSSALVIYLGVYLITVKLGLDYFVWARLVLTMGGLLLHLVLLRLVLDVRIINIILYILLMVAVSYAISSLVKFLSAEIDLKIHFGVILEMTLAASVLGATLVYLERNRIIKDLISILKKESV